MAGVLDHHREPGDVRHGKRAQPEPEITTQNRPNEATKTHSNHCPYAQLGNQQQACFKQKAEAVGNEAFLEIGICQSQKVRGVVRQESVASQAQ